MGFFEGTSGTRDRTQMHAKGPTGTVHIFVTLEEVEDYVQNYVTSAGSSLSPYLIVRDADEFVAAMESSFAFNVFCDDGSGTGIVVSALNDYSFSPVINKNVYGAGGYTLYQSGTGTANLTVTYPTSDNGNDIKINFFDKIYMNGSSTSTAGFYVSGGYSSNDYELNFTTIEVGAYQVQINAETGQTNMYGKTRYENVSSSLYEPIYIDGADVPVNGAWSGKNIEIRRKESESGEGIYTTETETHRNIHAVGNNSTNLIYHQSLVEPNQSDFRRTRLESGTDDGSGGINIYTAIESRYGSGSVPATIDFIAMDVNYIEQNVFRVDGGGGVFAYNLKQGTSQANAGAAVDELWRDTNDNTIKIGV